MPFGGALPSKRLWRIISVERVSELFGIFDTIFSLYMQSILENI